MMTRRLVGRAFLAVGVCLLLFALGTSQINAGA